MCALPGMWSSWCNFTALLAMLDRKLAIVSRSDTLGRGGAVLPSHSLQLESPSLPVPRGTASVTRVLRVLLLFSDVELDVIVLARGAGVYLARHVIHDQYIQPVQHIWSTHNPSQGFA